MRYLPWLKGGAKIRLQEKSLRVLAALETVRSYTERSYGEDHILEALDVLSREIREALGESLYQIHQADKPLPQVTTRSLSALQQYAEGSVLWR